MFVKVWMKKDGGGKLRERFSLCKAANAADAIGQLEAQVAEGWEILGYEEHLSMASALGVEGIDGKDSMNKKKVRLRKLRMVQRHGSYGMKPRQPGGTVA